jgi:hypothetical protein
MNRILIAIPLLALACGSTGSGSANRCVLSSSANARVGTPLAIKIAMLDSSGKAATGYTGSVALTATDPKAIFDNGGQFTSADSGTKAVAAELGTASGLPTVITATDTSNPNLSCTTNVVVSAGPASGFTIGLPFNVNAGSANAIKVTAVDEQGNPAASFTGAVTFTSSDAKATLPPATTFAATDNGVKLVSATLQTMGAQTLTATSSAIASTTPTTVHGLTYVNPTGGTLQLVADASSTAGSLVLKLVPTVALTGSSAGFNLPLDVTKVALDATAPIANGSALKLGAGPAALKAAIPAAGPLAGKLVVGVAQKGYDAGAAVPDAAIKTTDSLLAVKLSIPGAATPGVVFDGAALGAGFSAGLRDRAGNELVRSSQVAIGKLILQ